MNQANTAIPPPMRIDAGITFFIQSSSRYVNEAPVVWININNKP
jgi:hypothetical protein